MAVNQSRTLPLPKTPTVSDPSEITRLIETLKAQGVKAARISHSDLYGKCRSKELPIDELEMATDGLGYCVVSMLEDLQGNPLDVEGFAADSPFPDMQAIADLTTARIMPWDPETVWFLADLRLDQRLSPRNVLRRVCSGLAEQGLSATCAPELEFYLLRPGKSEFSERYGAGPGLAYTAGRRADPEGVFKRMHSSLHELGIGVTSAHHEFSPGQFEINLRHGPALESADRAFLFKEAVRELAALEELEANFMAKPFNDSEGSSLHVHVSVHRDGQNIFQSEDDPAALSELCRQFIAGILEHAPAITALASPTVNSYRRLSPEGLCPLAADWGYDHRFAYLRVPPEHAESTRVEMRGGDASANPYLVTAAVLVAGMDGMSRALEPPAPRESDAKVSPGPELPKTLNLALDALEADKRISEALGSELVRTFVALKRAEAERGRLTVTDWDWREYAFHS